MAKAKSGCSSIVVATVIALAIIAYFMDQNNWWHGVQLLMHYLIHAVTGK